MAISGIVTSPNVDCEHIRTHYAGFNRRINTGSDGFRRGQGTSGKVRDMLDVELIDASWTGRFPPELAERLQHLIDTPEG
jgi:hypothetical protein